MITINIRQPNSEPMGESFKFLASFLEQINNIKVGQEVTIDLTDVEFVYPILVLPIAAVINEKRDLL